MKPKRPIYAVILAGGSGTRFWPASRRLKPKQLLSLAPNAPDSLIAQSVRRVSSWCAPSHILVATGKHLLDAMQAALPELPSDAFLAEPTARGTAACIGWAAALINERDPEALVMVLPSDQLVTDEPEFIQTVNRALQQADTGTITTVGIKPTRAETGYGYIEVQAPIASDVYRAAGFKEKPNAKLAEEYLKSGRHYWNSGMFFFQVRTLLSEMEQHLPDLASGLRRLTQAVTLDVEASAATVQDVFEELPNVSIDEGIMEKISHMHVVTAAFGWNDLGSWQSAWDVAAKDARGNSSDSDAIFLDASNNLVRDLRTGSRQRVTSLLGVSDLCVILTDDALLVVPRERAQDVRTVVEALQSAKQFGHT